MTTRTGIVVLSALLAAAVPLSSATACSMRPGYMPPTNLELAAVADTIVIAQVDGERKGKDIFDTSVLATPVTLLKGSTLPPRIELSSSYLSDGEMMFRSDPRELRSPNPGALIGGCVRYIFPSDARLLLFLKRDDTGKLVPYRAAFSRDAEDVGGTDALWVKAVREYVAIARLPVAERPGAMRRRIAGLRMAGGADADAIAADMAIELSGKR